MADQKERVPRFPGYTAVLPPRVRYDRELSATAKLLFCEIMAMTDTRGYCWATNRYLADLMQITKEHCSRTIAELGARGYVRTVVMKTEKGGVKERHIFVEDLAMTPLAPIDKNINTPIDEKINTPIDKNINENVKSIEHTPYSPPRGTRARQHKKTADYRSDDFERLWEWYPGDPARHDKRGNRQRAIRAWDSLSPSPELIDTMAEALARQADSEEWQEGIGIPHLSTWLNGAGWEGWEQEVS